MSREAGLRELMKQVSPLDSWALGTDRSWSLQGRWKPKPGSGKALQGNKCVGVPEAWALTGVTF